MILCDGDLDCFFKTALKLTWLEEWVFYFEFTYGRVNQRRQDYVKSYDCRGKTLRKVLRRKLNLQIETREQWLMYASYEEDAKFRSDAWDMHFDKKDGSRIIMHDATNIPFPCPSDSELQRAMYSDYYGMPCAKGGISNQLCGWIRTIPLFTGRITDSQMIKDSGILKQQRLFSEADPSSNKPFTNVFDKGFRNTLDAMLEGKQTRMQPRYSKGSGQFDGNDTLWSACVAVIRSGNERAVQRCKMSWFLKRGNAHQMWDTDLICDVWEGWGFQTNFTHDKFL